MTEKEHSRALQEVHELTEEDHESVVFFWEDLHQDRSWSGGRGVQGRKGGARPECNQILGWHDCGELRVKISA